MELLTRLRSVVLGNSLAVVRACFVEEVEAVVGFCIAHRGSVIGRGVVLGVSGGANAVAPNELRRNTIS